MMVTGEREKNSVPLVAVVDCRPRYCIALCKPPPNRPSSASTAQSRAAKLRSLATRPGSASGASISMTSTTRAEVISPGEMSSRTARATIQLPAHSASAETTAKYAAARTGLR
jgi:hypothetical protein